MDFQAKQPKDMRTRARCSAALPLFAIFMFSGCLSPDPAPFDDVLEPTPVQFERVGHGRQAILDTTTLRVITGASVWDAYRDSLRSLIDFAPVNFEQEMILLAAVSVNTGGYDLRIEYVELSGDTLTAAYNLFTPGADCLTSMATGVVFDAVRIRRFTPADVQFLAMEEPLDCTIQ